MVGGRRTQTKLNHYITNLKDGTMTQYIGLIDIHNHTIPYVDDGARDIQTAIDMLKEAYAEGIREIILTPHYHGGHVETTQGETFRRYEELIEAKEQAGIDINLYIGNEIYYYRSIAEWINDGVVATLADSDYVLAEFGNAVTLRELKEAVNTIAGAGYVPIVAHAERYESIINKKENLAELIRMGALIQMNSEAITGDAGRKAKRLAKWALKNEMVHFIGTDAHSMGRRKPRMQEAAQYVASKFSEDYMYRLFVENPTCVINNEEIYQ